MPAWYQNFRAIKWVSSGSSDCNFDYQASFTQEEMAAKRALYNFTDSRPEGA